ncbi:MAG: serine protease inhibitor ecotin [Shewanella sp.]
MKLTQLVKAAVLPLSLALFSISAAAVSPPPTGVNAPMISVLSYTPHNYVAHEQTKMYPAPQIGTVQHILTLPQLENEQDYQLEIQIGKTQWVDCNRHSLRGELKEHTVEGWGYPYYQVDTVTPGASTRMACPEQDKQEVFVRIPGELKLQYDSRLPKVFYLPEGTELRFRTWKVDSLFQYSK